MAELLLKRNHFDTMTDSESEESWIMSGRNSHKKRWCPILALIGLLCVILLAVMGMCALLTKPMTSRVSGDREGESGPPRNVIFMISDGYGPASASFARSYYQAIHDLPYDHKMPLDEIHVGQSRTRSASTLITDSAAGATAFSCGLKTYNGAVGVDPQRFPCGTILESAKHKRGMMTGLVVTSRVTHATPAAFSAHMVSRNQESAIAAQQLGDNPLGRSLDLMMGGGACYFIPKSVEGSCRGDQRNLLEEAETFGWKSVWTNRTPFDAVESSSAHAILPLLALFSSDHLAFEIDRKPNEQPSLKEMTGTALELLSAATENSDQGFFLLVEGSRIDMAAHGNDPVAHVHDILQYQETVALVKEFVDAHPGTILISTSDHETGGLSLARQVAHAAPEYLWYPDVLAKATRSTFELAKDLYANTMANQDYVKQEILEAGLGITDATDAELTFLLQRKSEKSIALYLADMVSLRAQLGWATRGHSGVDVNLYAYGPNTNALFGSHENTDIGRFVERLFDLNTTDITRQLNLNNPSFHLVQLTEQEKINYTDHLQHYHYDPENLDHHSF